MRWVTNRPLWGTPKVAGLNLAEPVPSCLEVADGQASERHQARRGLLAMADRVAGRNGKVDLGLALRIGEERMERAQKAEFIEMLHGVFSNTGVIVVAHYSGLTVADMTNLRRQVREAGGHVKVAKNRLAKIALEGTQIAGISDLFTGPTVLVFSDDLVAAPKSAVNFAKANDKLIILGGAMGETILDLAAVKSLASLPSLDELRGQLAGLVQAPAAKIARVLNAPAGQLARVVSAYSETDKAA